MATPTNISAKIHFFINNRKDKRTNTHRKEKSVSVHLSLLCKDFEILVQQSYENSVKKGTFLLLLVVLLYHQSGVLSVPNTKIIFIYLPCTGGVRNISNELSIRTNMDLMSPDLIETAKRLNLYSEEKGPFDFKTVFCAQSQTDPSSANSTSFRYRHGKEVLEKAAVTG